MALPLRAFIVRRLEDAHPGFLAGLVAEDVANADYQLVAAVAVEVGAPDGMAPFQLVVQDVTVPQSVRIVGWRVHNDLVAVPRFDGGNEGPAILELAELDLAGAAAAFGVRLITDAELAALPFLADAAEQVDALVA